MITYLGPEDMQAVLALASQVEDIFGRMVGVADFETGLQECLKTNRVLGCREQNELCGAAILDLEGTITDSNEPLSLRVPLSLGAAA